MASNTDRRKMWSEESMVAATNSVLHDNKGVREASRLYNVPFETLRRRVKGIVQNGCRPGPATILSEEEEDHLASYLKQMSEMGYGLGRETVMRLAFTIVDKTQRKHPFKEEKAGRAWFDGFIRRHPRLTIRSPQPLSYSRALCSNPDTLRDFFGKLGSMYGKLNLISKPMQIYNSDETGVSVVHKPGKVVAELGRRNVYAITSAERGKTHTILSCVSASGHSLLPMMVYPRKKSIPESLKTGAIPHTFFANSESGWMNSELYFLWFKFFLQNIPPVRPVLLIQDGHGSHISIDLIELARANDVHLLCLPSHTTHILQPLDVGVFKSFKSHFSKACSRYLANNPGRVITNDKLACLVAEAWPQSFTAVNIMAGFKKSGIYPINPGEVTDRQLAPSKVFCHPTSKPSIESKEPVAEHTSNSSSPLFSPEMETLYRKRYEEHYDINDTSYLAWLKINHPEADLSGGTLSSSSLASCSKSGSQGSSGCKAPSSSEVLSEVLVLPCEISRPKCKDKSAVNSKVTVCITDDDVLEELKFREEEKAKRKKEAEAKRLKRVERKKEREQKQQEKEQKISEKLNRQSQRRKKKEEVKSIREGKREHKNSGKSNEEPVDRLFAKLKLSVDDVISSSEESDAVCPKCGLVYSDSGGLWVCCDLCNEWFDIKCTNIKKRSIPEVYYCEDCVNSHQLTIS